METCGKITSLSCILQMTWYLLFWQWTNKHKKEYSWNGFLILWNGYHFSKLWKSIPGPKYVCSTESAKYKQPKNEYWYFYMYMYTWIFHLLYALSMIWMHLSTSSCLVPSICGPRVIGVELSKDLVFDSSYDVSSLMQVSPTEKGQLDTYKIIILESCLVSEWKEWKDVNKYQHYQQNCNKQKIIVHLHMDWLSQFCCASSSEKISLLTMHVHKVNKILYCITIFIIRDTKCTYHFLRNCAVQHQ